MAIATIQTTSLVPAGRTQTSLYNAIKTLMQAVGWTVFSEFTESSTLNIVFSRVFDGTKAKGTAYLRVQVPTTLLTISSLLDNWNATNNTGTNPSNSNTSSAVNASLNLDLFAVNHPEWSGLLLSQGTTILNLLSVARPASRPVFWNEDHHLYAIFPLTSGPFRPIGGTGNPYNQPATTNCSSGAPTPGAATNGVTGRREFYPCPVLANTGQGFWGAFSNDIGAVGGGLTPGDVLIDGATRYAFVINPNFAIRSS